MSDKNYSKKDILTEEECAALDIQGRLKRVTISTVHLILMAVGFILCFIWQRDLLSTIIFFSLGYIIIHLILKRIPNIGFYNPGYYEIWDGKDCTRIRDESYVKFYGFGSIGFEVVIEMVGYIIAMALMYFILPPVMSYAVILGAIFIATFKCIIFPTLCDIVNIVSKRSPRLELDTINKVTTFVGIGLVVVYLIGGCFVFPVVSPKVLDPNAAIEQYYTENTYETNPLNNIDISDFEKKFKFFGTKCTLTNEGEFDYNSGLVKEGKAKVELEYMLTHWEVKRVTPTLTAATVNSPVTFSSEEVVELADYNGLAMVKVAINKFDGANGNGNLTVTDKATDKVVYKSDFKLEPKNDIIDSEYTLKAVLNNPIQFGYFGFGSLEFIWNISTDKIELETFANELTLDVK